jgi:hypothetical protein
MTLTMRRVLGSFLFTLCSGAGTVLAQYGERDLGDRAVEFALAVGSTLCYGVIAIGLVAGGTKLAWLVLPKQIQDDFAQHRSTAVGVVFGALLFGVCFVVASLFRP